MRATNGEGQAQPPKQGRARSGMGPRLRLHGVHEPILETGSRMTIEDPLPHPRIQLGRPSANDVHGRTGVKQVGLQTGVHRHAGVHVQTNGVIDGARALVASALCSQVPTSGLSAGHGEAGTAVCGRPPRCGQQLEVVEQAGHGQHLGVRPPSIQLSEQHRP